jgi:raffinose/stachyose/melibiose transport system substrate-binding protein
MMQDQKAKGINGLSLSQESYFLIGHILNTPFALQDNPNQFVSDLAAGKVKMADTPEFQEFAQFYAAIRDNAQNPLEINYDKEIGDLATGKSAAIHQGNWCAGMFKDFDLKFELGMMPLPIAGNDCLAVSVPSAWYVNSQAPAAEKLAGKDFLTWLYTSKTGTKYLMEEFGFIPVVAGMQSQKLDVLSQEVARFTEAGKTIPWPMSQWPAGIVDVYLVPIAEQFFTTDMSPDELLAELDKAWAEASK